MLSMLVPLQESGHDSIASYIASVELVHCAYAGTSLTRALGPNSILELGVNYWLWRLYHCELEGENWSELKGPGQKLALQCISPCPTLPGPRLNKRSLLREHAYPCQEDKIFL